MRVLSITGDKKFGPGHSRFELQRSAVEDLSVLYWGRGNFWPRLPSGVFDVVTVQDPFWRGLFAWRAARRIGAPLQVQVHADLAAQSLLKRMVAQFVLRRADAVRVVSERLKAQMEPLRIRAPISVLPIFIDVSRFRNLPRKPHAQKTLLWLGRFEKEKDPERMIELFREVQKQGLDVKLVMLGKGSLEEQLHAQAQGLPVEFPGWQDPVTYFPEADLVVSTSPAESWGASIVEALAAGVPVVTLDVGIAKEAGAIITSREGMAKAIIEALQSDARGELRLVLPTMKEWAVQWRESLAPQHS